MSEQEKGSYPDKTDFEKFFSNKATTEDLKFHNPLISVMQRDTDTLSPENLVMFGSGGESDDVCEFINFPENFQQFHDNKALLEQQSIGNLQEVKLENEELPALSEEDRKLIIGGRSNTKSIPIPLFNDTIIDMDKIFTLPTGGLSKHTQARALRSKHRLAKRLAKRRKNK